MNGSVTESVSGAPLLLPLPPLLRNREPRCRENTLSRSVSSHLSPVERGGREGKGEMDEDGTRTPEYARAHAGGVRACVRARLCVASLIVHECECMCVSVCARKREGRVREKE